MRRIRKPKLGGAALFESYSGSYSDSSEPYKFLHEMSHD
jgi:hypothetical protein